MFNRYLFPSDLVNAPEPLVVKGDDLPAQELFKEVGDPGTLNNPGHSLAVGDGVAALHEGHTAPATPGVQNSSLHNLIFRDNLNINLL